MLKIQKKLIFFDAAQFPKATFTDEGFLKADAIITRSGVFNYELASGKKISVFRPPQEVFSDESMESMKMVPLTNGHPPTRTRLLDSKTAKTFTVGHLGETITNENNRNLRGKLIVTDAKTIDEIKSGKRQLSYGYTADLCEESGFFDGQPYTHVHKNIKGNHVAIVSQGRMGSNAAIVLDGADAIQISNFNEEEDNTMSQNLQTVVLDGIEYQAAPEVTSALEKVTGELETVKAELTNTKVVLDEKTAKIDALQQASDDFSKRDISAEVTEATNKRFGLLNTVKSVFGDEIYAKVQAFTDHDIKCEVLQPLYKDKDLKKESGVYLDTLFDATIEAQKTAKMVSQRSTLAMIDGKKDTISNNEISPFQKRLSGGLN